MKVFMVAAPTVDWKEYSDFLRDEGVLAGHGHMVEPPSAAQQLVELAGRLCYMSYEKGRKSNGEFIRNIIDHQHFSVLEHANWSFIITGVSRTLTHELVRHRHFSYSQLSQRYVDHTNMKLVKPEGWPANMDDAWDDLCDVVKGHYADVADALGEGQGTTGKKVARTICRAVLPGAMETKIVVTGNARAWREFIQKRNTRFADPEIRALAQEILRRLWANSPDLFGDLLEAQ